MGVGALAVTPAAGRGGPTRRHHHHAPDDGPGDQRGRPLQKETFIARSITLILPVDSMVRPSTSVTLWGLPWLRPGLSFG